MSSFSHKDRLPPKLSPSRAKDFLQCPRLFYYKTILGLSTPSTVPTAVGTLAHHAFERIFDHPRVDRTPETALSYIDPAWEMLTVPVKNLKDLPEGSPEYVLRKENSLYAEFFEENPSSLLKALSSADDYLSLVSDGQAVLDLLGTAKTKVSSWFAMENPQKFDPYERELHVEHALKKVTVHGFIDRVDRVESSKGTSWYISDFKTGKLPHPRYLDDVFFQLEVYALCLFKEYGFKAKELRLVYVTAGDPSGVLTRKVSDVSLSQTERKLNSIWSSISACATASEWAPKPQVLCSWCPFKEVCPAHNPGLEGLLPEEIALRTDTKLTK